jgi:hypothetical protein
MVPERRAARHVVEAFGLHRPHSQRWCIGFERQRHAGGKATAAAAHQNVGTGDAVFRRLFGYLQPAGALTRDHQRVRQTA